MTKIILVVGDTPNTAMEKLTKFQAGLSRFENLEEIIIKNDDEEEAPKVQSSLADDMAKLGPTLATLKLQTKTFNALTCAYSNISGDGKVVRNPAMDIAFVSQLHGLTDEDLSKYFGIGKKSILEIRHALKRADSTQLKLDI